VASGDRPTSRRGVARLSVRWSWPKNWRRPTQTRPAARRQSLQRRRRRRADRPNSRRIGAEASTGVRGSPEARATRDRGAARFAWHDPGGSASRTDRLHRPCCRRGQTHAPHHHRKGDRRGRWCVARGGAAVARRSRLARPNPGDRAGHPARTAGRVRSMYYCGACGDAVRPALARIAQSPGGWR